MSLIIFLIVLAILVLVHEFGHFIVAKKSGIRVDEFGLGFPPRIFGKKYGETIYSLNWIPFGGFVKIFGENPDTESLHGADSPRSLVHKPKYIQVAVLIAGVVCNFMFAWLLVSIAFVSGVAASKSDYAQYADRLTNDRVIVTNILPHSPASAAGIRAGDVLHVVSIEALQKLVAASNGAPVSLEYESGGVTKNARLTPTESVVPGQYAIGIGMEHVGTLSLPIHLAVYEGGRFTLDSIVGVARGLGDFILGIFKGTADYTSVSGPVGIIGMVGDATKLGFVYLLMFTAMISINLGVINLIPFPALDGGRILFVLIEAVRRKALPPSVANTVNSIGFVLLILLMLIVTYKDIVKLVVR